MTGFDLEHSNLKSLNKSKRWEEVREQLLDFAESSGFNPVLNYEKSRVEVFDLPIIGDLCLPHEATPLYDDNEPKCQSPLSLAWKMFRKCKPYRFIGSN